MKKALLKDSIKEIKNTYKRFISILLMAFLGVGFFAGIRATSPDMLNTIDAYYKNQNVYDIEIVSTLGLTEEDVNELKNVEGVKSVEGIYNEDVIINESDLEYVAKILDIKNTNVPILLEGNMPIEENECVVEKNVLTKLNKAIGDTIQLETEEKSKIKEKNLKIVGIVQSPLYISRDRGTTTLASGKIDFYVYVKPENINEDVYTRNLYKNK